MLPVLDIVGWHHEAQGTLLPLYVLVPAIPVLVVPVLLDIQRLPYGYTQSPLGLDMYMPPCFHFSLASEFRLPLQVHSDPQYSYPTLLPTFTNPSRTAKPVSPEELVGPALCA